MVPKLCFGIKKVLPNCRICFYSRLIFNLNSKFYCQCANIFTVTTYKLHNDYCIFLSFYLTNSLMNPYYT